MAAVAVVPIVLKWMVVGQMVVRMPALAAAVAAAAVPTAAAAVPFPTPPNFCGPSVWRALVLLSWHSPLSSPPHCLRATFPLFFCSSSGSFFFFFFCPCFLFFITVQHTLINSDPTSCISASSNKQVFFTKVAQRKQRKLELVEWNLRWIGTKKNRSL
mmetsp:Transcript_1416/g.2768  ORF Transcript_1416/g.2768 Transcript_1416/m.2768 type:complete len:158 (-) Transcript_1416:222-695(-)